MNDPCERCDGEDQDCVGCKAKRDYFIYLESFPITAREPEHNCYSCSRFDDCQTESEYMFEHCDEWRGK